MTENATDVPVTDRHRKLLTHMLGVGSHIKKNQHGYRNYFCAGIGGDDFAAMKDMESLGLVVAGHIINDGRDQYFFATLKGCESIGLSKAAIKRAMEK